MSSNSILKKIYSLLHTLFRKDIGRKLMALFLAVLVWFYVAQKVVNSVPHNLKIRVVTGRDAFIEESAKMGETFFIILPENLMEIRGAEDWTRLEDMGLTVTLSGPSERLPTKLVGSYEIITQKHLADKDENKVSIMLLKDYFKDLARIRGIGAKFDPEKIDVNLARRRELQIGLSAENNLEVEGTPPVGMEYDPSQVTFEPQVVRIEGPAPEIDRIAMDHTLFKLERIDLTDATRRISQYLECSQSLKDRMISMQTRDGIVSVKFMLREEEKQRDLVGVPVVLLDYGKPLAGEELARVELDAETIDVQLKGVPSLVDLFTDDQLRERIVPIIDLQGARETNTFDIYLTWGSDLSRSIRISIKGESKMIVRFLELTPPSGP